VIIPRKRSINCSALMVKTTVAHARLVSAATHKFSPYDGSPHRQISNFLCNADVSLCRSQGIREGAPFRIEAIDTEASWSGVRLPETKRAPQCWRSAAVRDVRSTVPREGVMERYNLELLQDGNVAAARFVDLENPKALWPRLCEFAQRGLAPGSHIRVTDADGGIVIFVGVASARRHFAPALGDAIDRS
jgi:hypothetical protein